MKFKIRCSQIGNIMTGEIGLTDNQENEYQTLLKKEKLTDKQKEKLTYLTNKKDNPELSQTTKSYIEQWMKEQIYNRKKEFSSKYTDKGNIVEDNSIDFVAEYLGFGLLAKNEQYFQNDFLTGTPDVITKDLVIDLKNSWDCFTFPLFESDTPKKDYYYQLQGYMALTGKEKAKLIYVLSDTPINLIEKEAYYWCKNNGYDELDIDVLKEFESKMTYSDIDNELKIKVFDIQRDETVIKEIYERVNLCRDYIKETLKDRDK